MSKIGTMNLNDDGTYTGKIETIGLDIDLVLIINENKKEGDKQPDFKAIVGTFEAGAGWKKTSDNENSYISLTLDDPTFLAPINANIVEKDGKQIILWQRKK